jgi:hypothetical protein
MVRRYHAALCVGMPSVGGTHGPPPPYTLLADWRTRKKSTYGPQKYQVAALTQSAKTAPQLADSPTHPDLRVGQKVAPGRDRAERNALAVEEINNHGRMGWATMTGDVNHVAPVTTCG